MKIIEGKINSSSSRQIKNNPTDRYSQTTRLSSITINNTKAMLQNHTLELKKGDLVAAGGFFLFGRFMVMTMVNKTRASSWANNPWLQMALGVFIMLIPFFTDNPLMFSRNIWLFLVLPFVLIGALFLYFGLDILRTSRSLNALLLSASHESKKQPASKDAEDDMEKIFYRVIWVAVAVLALWLMLAVTGPKLYKMAQIRGFIGGATLLERTITDKASQDWRTALSLNRTSSSGTNYFIAWNEQSALEAGPNRINIQQEQWEKLNIGDSIDLMRLPHDEATYIRTGIFASNGNFMFDAILLALQLAIIMNSIVRLARRPQFDTQA